MFFAKRLTDPSAPQDAERKPARWLRVPRLGGMLAAAAAATAFVLWITVWRPFHEARALIAAIQDRGGEATIVENRPKWLPEFVEGWRFLPWFDHVSAVKIRRIEDVEEIDSLLGRLRAFPDIQSLRLDDCRPSLLGLASIGRITRLTELTLWSCGVTDEHTVSLHLLDRLESLDLRDNPVGDQ